MTIELTHEEYRQLLDMLQIANWVVSARRPEPTPETEAYKDVEQKIASYASEMGMEDAIIYDEELAGYYPTVEYEAEYLCYIDEYDDDVFWTELASRLAERDLLEAEGMEQVLAMDPFERVSKLGVLEDMYAREFVMHGVTNVMIPVTPLLKLDPSREYTH